MRRAFCLVLLCGCGDGGSSSPGDATAGQMEAAADLADRFSAGEARLTHEQNLLLPWVHQDDLPELWAAARKAGFARPNIGLLTDLIACPGGDFCSLANARSLPVAEAITQRFQDLDEEFDLGDIRLNISGCINSCGHHHAGPGPGRAHHRLHLVVQVEGEQSQARHEVVLGRHAIQQARAIQGAFLHRDHDRMHGCAAQHGERGARARRAPV